MKLAKILLLVLSAWASWFGGLKPALAQVWTETGDHNVPWASVASSADGTKLLAICHGDGTGGLGSIYASTDSGVTWAQTSAPSNQWTCVCSSADGTTIVAAPRPYTIPALIYVSKDSGITWTSNNTTSAEWYSVASSADGTKLVAVGTADTGDEGVVYTSTNSGITWVSNSPPINTSCWSAVSSSADGSKLVVGSAYGQICISTNCGATWQPTYNALSNAWESVASSADGCKVVAVSELYWAAGGSIISSTDSGMTWTSNNVPSADWTSVASSADGNKLVAVVGIIYVSTDSGATWTPDAWTLGDFSNGLLTVASSADGCKLVGVDGGGIYSSAVLGPIFTSYTTPSPQLNLVSLSTNLLLSWIIPSTTFLLQQSSDLTNWSIVTNQSTLNFTNLQNQVTLPLPSGNSLYRLKSL
jgi:photosystem II stability/assembly factor-like uncharacterized protein